MRTFFTFIVLIFAILLFVASSSEAYTKIIANYKYSSHSLLGSDKYSYGDLYGFSRLASFRKNYRTVYDDIKLEKKDTSKHIDLYFLCDSYIWSLAGDPSLYSGVDRLLLARSNNEERINILSNSGNKKVLMLEFAERNFYPFLHDHNEYLQTFLTIDSSQNKSSLQTEQTTLIKKIKSFITEYVFNYRLNSNIEFNFWESRLFTPVKELKASINQKLFNRIDKDVSLGTDGKYLLYAETIDKKGYSASSFEPINDLEIDTLVSRLNFLYSNYKTMGFDEVYLSIIPNPVTILYPHYNGYKYNNLIPRIQKNTNLKIKLVDVYEDFQKSRYQIYQNSDTHWSKNGLNLWLNKFNVELSKY